ncbi:AAA family ATPase [Mycobacterium sp. CVI_P3]|uniref:AAA family ATPase n=1 Tax=Mycobacterium pinniadriaticum TaxID=2994102 RepID=A0ABT3SK64_9MYCO|nr:adenylate/guanylate cyclase domain-containing protein [Mycobacterium pinniadriaticum]MCX2933443.1 AAA family ATPase [Mycobacterium pinniadriaticum]MCX2939918.1 AAA family ATPase [Mycobacterium pinniadriaticum]
MNSPPRTFWGNRGMVGSEQGFIGKCGSCGNDLRARARFCDVCGSAAAWQSVRGEYKQVTVLFADVVGSMRLAESLRPEQLQAVMHELFNRTAAVVQRFQGTVAMFTGDGLMALFGAPLALEDHALRACISALEIQSVTEQLAAELLRDDGIDLKVRVGLNSGEVVAGEIGSGRGTYTAVGHPVGMAQRMESAAPPGGVLCSQTTSRLVERSARLGPLTNVQIKGSDAPVPARQLLEIRLDRMVLGRSESQLVGRDPELGQLTSVFAAKQGALMSVIGAPGLGKTLLVKRFTEFAAARDARIVVARCEAHTTGVSFRALARLMRALFDVDGLPAPEARTRVVAQLDGQYSESVDAQILFDAMGLHDGDDPPQFSVDGRRRRLVDTLANAVRIHGRRTVFVLEDAHWIDGSSDEVITAFAAAVAKTGSIFVTTYRPEYRGVLHRSSTRTVELQGLSHAAAARAVGQILGDDPSTAQLCQQIAHAAAGNPFFAEEIVRDLASRGVLNGNRGSYRVSGKVDHISVPATVQAVLAARIDRLRPETKSILNAAAVIGSRFDADTLQTVLPQTTPESMAELVAAQLIDQTEFVPAQRFCFHHPLVRAVAYDSQLHATRARTHNAVAEAIQRRPTFSDESAAMVAAHLEAAGQLVDAYRWHMRAAAWLRPRDLPAARAQWDSARRVADELPGEDNQVLDMRIAPRTMLVSTTLYVRDEFATDDTYRQLHALATKNGDLISLAIGMAGRMFSMAVNDNRACEALPLATELHELTTRIPADPAIGGLLLNAVAFTKLANGDFLSAQRIWAEILALGPGCPEEEIAPAQALLGFAQICLGDGVTGHRNLRAGTERARLLHPVNSASVQLYSAILAALGLVDVGSLLEDVRTAWQRAESFGDICGIILARWTYGTILVRSPDRHDEGIATLRSARATSDEHRLGACTSATTTADLALEKGRNGQLGEAIADVRQSYEEFLSGVPTFAVFPAEALVELLVARGSGDDLAEARRVLERWQEREIDVPALGLWPLRARTLLARAECDERAFADGAKRYLRLCEQLNAIGRLDEARQLAGAAALRNPTR